MRAIIVVILLVVVGGVYFLTTSQLTPSEENLSTSTRPPAAVETKQFEPFTATFEIHTNGTKRIFTDPRYHTLSEEVFITSENPAEIQVHKEGTTWADFFTTLPMQLSADCLVTGTGQTFCTSDSGTLRFYINDVEDANALTKEIASGDHLKVEYAQ
jgi:hypothetical protein